MSNNNNTPHPIPAGTEVRVVDVDEYSFCGRDLHPARHMIDWRGKCNGVVTTETIDGSDDVVRIYQVTFPNGRLVDFTDYEIEVVS